MLQVTAGGTAVYSLLLGQVMELGLSCYLVLLSTDSR